MSNKKIKKILNKNWNQIKYLFENKEFEMKRNKYLEALRHDYNHIDALLYAYSNKKIEFNKMGIIKNNQLKAIYLVLLTFLLCFIFISIFIFLFKRHIEKEFIEFFFYHFKFIILLFLILFIFLTRKILKIYIKEEKLVDYIDVSMFFAINFTISILFFTFFIFLPLRVSW